MNASSLMSLVLGGTRSGKSEFAEALVSQYGPRILYIATAEVYEGDGSMRDRVAKHQARRPDSWHTKECPLHIGRTLATLDWSACDAVILDCVTLWTSNVLFSQSDSAHTVDFANSGEEGESAFLLEKAEAHMISEVDELLPVIKASGLPWVLVSSEVGLGLMSGDRLTRAYADILGKVNQRLATQADSVHLVVAGIPIKVK